MYLTCQSKKIASNVGKEGIFCSTKVTKQHIAEKKDSTSEIESSHVTLVFYCCGLECREPSESRQEACLLTQLSVCADFTSQPLAVLATLL